MRQTIQAAPLGERIRPCGPVVDAVGAGRLLDRLAEAADSESWRDRLDAAWPALAPVFAASPYLAGLVQRMPERLRISLSETPEARLAHILAATQALGGDPDAVRRPLRMLKAELHLLTALADLGGVWDLDAVTGALSHFADAAVGAALAAVAVEQRARGRLAAVTDPARGPIPGLFGLAMGKHGAFELNYSSDIDLSLFFDPEALQASLEPGIEVQRFTDRAAQRLSTLLSERTADGYVFRVDLRLRPDPSSTPPVVNMPMALAYYESVGQNWERAAFIKARPVCGDPIAAQAFLEALQPFIWRRSLDYQAVLDIQSIKRQIHVHKTGEGLSAAGANLKLGRGGIREIEFYAQTQQLILGGRDPALRSPRTLDALDALEAAGHLPRTAVDDLSAAYVRLRSLEHRVQMLDDEQTHILPEDPDRRRAVAALAGQAGLTAFDAEVEAVLIEVNRLYGDLFGDAEDLSSSYGSLVFTGVENDPETLATLARMGFDAPAEIADTIRSWHHGRIPATRSARGRELFTRLAPRLLTAVTATGAPNAAFRRFSVFFSGLSAGVQVQALFLNQPALFALVVRVMAFAPRLARTLGRYPAALDSVLDARFLNDLSQDSGLIGQLTEETAAAVDFEDALNIVRRIHREQAFRIGLQAVTGQARPTQVGHAFTALADAAMQVLSNAALVETERLGGAFPGAVAVIALGKAGSREMTAASDLDLMTVYANAGDQVSAGRGWSAETFYARFTQRLISALSSRTAEGGLYEVDMRLRPSGSKGPVAVRLARLAAYYEDEAETWEFLALTRARLVWTNDPAFGARVEGAIEAALRRPRPGVDVAADVVGMRELMARERPGRGFWDLKLVRGGQVDAEFVAQFRQLKAAAQGEALTVSTLEALADDPALHEAWRLQQALNQLLNCTLDDASDPEAEPSGFRQALAEAVDQPDFEAVKRRLTDLRKAGQAAFEAVLGSGDGDSDSLR